MVTFAQKFSISNPFSATVNSINVVNGKNVGDYVNFSCKYPSQVSVSSASFTTKDTTVSDSTAGTGSLINGFSLKVYSDANFNQLVGNNPVFIGQRKMVKSLHSNVIEVI